MARPPAVIRAALAAALPDARCSMASATVAENGQATITGPVGVGEPSDALRREADKAGAAALNWRVTPFSGPYCQVLDILRPYGPAAGARVTLAAAGGRTALRDNEQVAVNLAMPDIGGHLHVAYLQNDGLASQMVPGPGYPARTYATGSRVELGRPRPPELPDGWRVGVPFGTDMIVAVVSTAPLFAEARPAPEPMDAYLRDLQAAIETLRRRGGSLAADVVVIETKP